LRSTYTKIGLAVLLIVGLLLLVRFWWR